jgi:hypothetical protein
MTISVPLSDWGPHVRAQVQDFNKRWPNFSWGTYPGHDPSEALATDGMVPGWNAPGGKAKGRAVANTLWSERKKNGLWYLIHWGEIISITYPNAGWRPYFNANNPDPSKNHHNHVHASWHSDGSAPAVVTDSPKPYTEGWLPSKPWTFYLNRQGPGLTEQSDSVWLIQRALNLKPRDGLWLPDREGAAVKHYQMFVLGDDPKYCDGILGRSQATKLFGSLVKIEDKA